MNMLEFYIIIKYFYKRDYCFFVKFQVLVEFIKIDSFKVDSLIVEILELL